MMYNDNDDNESPWGYALIIITIFCAINLMNLAFGWF